MTATLAESRRARATTLAIVAFLMAAVAAITIGIQVRASRPDLAAGAVLPGLSERIAQAQKIRIVSEEASYQIERVQRGEQSVWVMRDRGDFPVRAAPLATLTEGLEQLQYTRRMTADPDKFDRLGVGDPRQGGGGVLVQIEDAQGAFLVNLILGVETSGLYVRKPDQDQTWAARGELPPLRDVTTWLDLRPLSLEPETLARVEVSPREGRSYAMARESEAATDFDIVQPARLEPLARSRVTATAERLTRLSPVDVQPAPAIQGAPFARVHAVTFDDVELDGELIESDGKAWLKLVARSNDPEQEAAALAINDQVAGWAYALSDADVQALAPALEALLPPPPGAENERGPFED